MFRAAFPDARHLLDIFKAVNAVAGLILMLPMPRETTMANIVHRFVYNFVRVLLTLPLIMPLLLPVILLALQYYDIPFLGGAAA
jgi:hypothetical protein